MTRRLRVAILGGTGYGASELLRLLLSHPDFEIAAVASRSAAGRPLHEVHSHLRGFTDLRFVPSDPVAATEGVDAALLAYPHGVAREVVPALLAARPGLRLVDLSGDHRLSDPAVYEAHYGAPSPSAELLGSFVYGLPEVFRDGLRGANRVANPGCFATGAILALAPLARAGLLRGDVVVNGVTGSSGSGAEPRGGTHHPERSEDFRAYKALAHQHLPEMRQALGADGERARLRFVPHSAPMVRGIYTTVYAFPAVPVDEARIVEIYRAAYRGERFVRLVEGTPQARVVRHTNFCDLSVTVREGAVVVMTAIDNLVKGMAGQAVQNLNILFDLPETSGLLFPGTRP